MRFPKFKVAALVGVLLMVSTSLSFAGGSVEFGSLVIGGPDLTALLGRPANQIVWNGSVQTIGGEDYTDRGYEISVHGQHHNKATVIRRFSTTTTKPVVYNLAQPEFEQYHMSITWRKSYFPLQFGAEYISWEMIRGNECRFIYIDQDGRRYEGECLFIVVP